MTPDWLRDSVVKGLQGLIVLRLEGSPATDAVKALANAWIAVLANLPHTWDEDRDRPRLQRAFLILATGAERWPSPAMLIKVMPPVPQPLKLAPPVSKNMPPEARAFLDKFLKRKTA